MALLRGVIQPEYVCIRLKNGRQLFIASKNPIQFLCNAFSIAETNVANLRPVLETKMHDANAGLKIFMQHLDAIADLSESMIIHCAKGLHRSPVATCIFLVKKMGYTFAEAKEAVVTAMKTRIPGFVLDQHSMYSLVLNKVESEATQLLTQMPVSFHHRVRVPERELEEITEQNQLWYGA